MPILINNIGQLLTMDSDSSGLDGIGLIENGAVYIENEIIKWAGKEQDLPGKYSTEQDLDIVDAGGNAVMPGLVDAHTHLIFAGSRENEFAMRLRGATYEEILAAGGGIHSTVKATRAASKDELVESGLIRSNDFLTHGVTTVEIKSGYGLETETELKILQAAKNLDSIHHVDIVPTFLGAHVMPGEYKENRKAYIDKIKSEMIPEIKKYKLAEYIDVFIEEGAYSIEESREIISAGVEAGLKPRLHIDQLHNIGGVKLAAEMNAVSVDHLEEISDEDIDLLAESGIVAMLLPGATFFLRMNKYPPAGKLIKRGVKTAISTDFNPGSSNTTMPYLIMTIACLQMGMTVEDVLIGYTRIPAESLGRDDRGIIAEGKLADIIILDIENYNTIPYRFGRNHVKSVIKNGRILIK